MDYIILPRDYSTNITDRCINEKEIERITKYWNKIAEDWSKRVRESERITSEDLAVTITA